MISILIPSGILLAVYWARFFVLRYRRGEKLPLSVPLAFTCLFVPKVNLFDVNRTYSTAGIRTDDLLIVILLIIALREAYTYRNKYIRWGIGFLAAMTAASLVSMLTGRAGGYDNNILFSVLSSLRKVEYFALAVIGIYIARNTEQAEKRILTEFTWMSCFHLVIAGLQVAKVCGYAVAGIISDKPAFWDVGIAASTFNGHYEYGHFLCFGTAVYLCRFLRTKKAGSLGMLLASCGMIWLTDSRSSLMVALALIVLILLFSIRKTSPWWIKAGAAAGVLIFAAAAILFATGRLKIGRFDVVNLGEYTEALRVNLENGNLHQYVENHRGDGWEFAGIKWISDGSASIRFYRWGAAMDGFRQLPLFGYGTGVTHTMDGSYVKLLGEGGIIGTLLWLGMYGFFMKAVFTARKTVPMARGVLWIMISILFASVFIDMFEASKPMEMMWLAAGLVIGLAAVRPAEKPEEPGKDCLTGEEA